MNLVEDYCSYELAKLLKEKGFYGHTHGNLSEIPCVPQITHQLACKWLREVKDIDIVIMPLFRFKGGKIYCYEIHSDDIDVREGRFDTYEQAVEAALKYALENLI